jgi:chromosome segregation ATPase
LTVGSKRLERSLKENEVTTQKLTEAETLCKQLKSTLYSVKRTKEKVMKSEQIVKKLYEEGQKDLSRLDKELAKTRKRLTVAIEEKVYFEKSVLTLRRKLKELGTNKKENVRSETLNEFEKTILDMKKLKQENTSLRSLVAVQQLRKRSSTADKSCLTDPLEEKESKGKERNEENLSGLRALKTKLGEEKLKVEALQKTVEVSCKYTILSILISISKFLLKEEQAID